MNFLFESEFSFRTYEKTFCYCVSLSCFVWIYNHTVTIVSQKYQELCLVFKQYLLGVFILETQLANILDRGFLFLRNTLLLYSLSPSSQTELWRNKYTCFAWAGGTFSPVVLLCQFSVLVGNRFWFYILMYLEYNTVVVLC